MMTLLAGFYAFLLENWLAVLAGVALVGGWLLICRELCMAAEPEIEESAKRPAWARGVRPRPVLSSQRHSQHTLPQASLRIRRS